MADQHEHAVVMRAAVGDPRECGDELGVVARVGPRGRRRSAPNARRARRRARRRRRRSRRRARAGAQSRLACRAFASAFSTNVECGSSAPAMPSSAWAHDFDAQRRRAAAGIRAACRRCRRRGPGGERAACATPWPATSRLERSASAQRPARGCPAPASATSASISARVNGAPSAVPCISTKPPRPVMTTFMSVPQAGSSA